MPILRDNCVGRRVDSPQKRTDGRRWRQLVDRFVGKFMKMIALYITPAAAKSTPRPDLPESGGPRLVLCLNNPPGDFIGLSGQCCLWSGWIVQVWSRRLGDVGQRWGSPDFILSVFVASHVSHCHSPLKWVPLYDPVLTIAAAYPFASPSCRGITELCEVSIDSG